jgi:2-phospho-L-lactate/phosphoenolpyruvate guanylyltransferase
VHTPSWALVVPIKPLATAKSRSSEPARDLPARDLPARDLPARDLPARDLPSRAGLALGFAQDTVAAALACDLVASVIVVCDDGAVSRALTALGAHVVPDKPDAGLNAAVRHGASFAGAGPVAALAADLPALRPADLAAALAAATGRRSFVPDTPGTGTVLLAAPAGIPLDPHFGPDSAAAHAASGAVRLAGRWPSLRRDVDTPADLAEAATLGLGRHTSILLR